jgi:hypothetical protein
MQVLQVGTELLAIGVLEEHRPRKAAAKERGRR